jgi:hypothetical protein
MRGAQQGAVAGVLAGGGVIGAGEGFVNGAVAGFVNGAVAGFVNNVGPVTVATIGDYYRTAGQRSAFYERVLATVEESVIKGITRPGAPGSAVQGVAFWTWYHDETRAQTSADKVRTCGELTACNCGASKTSPTAVLALLPDSCLHSSRSSTTILLCRSYSAMRARWQPLWVSRPTRARLPLGTEDARSAVLPGDPAVGVCVPRPTAALRLETHPAR